MTNTRKPTKCSSKIWHDKRDPEQKSQFTSTHITLVMYHILNITRDMPRTVWQIRECTLSVIPNKEMTKRLHEQKNKSSSSVNMIISIHFFITVMGQQLRTTKLNDKNPTSAALRPNRQMIEFHSCSTTIHSLWNMFNLYVSLPPCHHPVWTFSWTADGSWTAGRSH